MVVLHALQPAPPAPVPPAPVPPAQASGSAADGLPAGSPYPYAEYTELTGPLREVDPDAPYRVQFQSLLAREPHRARVVLLTVLAFAVELAFVVWLLQPSHWPPASSSPLVHVLSLVMAASLGVVELLRLVNVFTLAAATLLACDPVPVRPDPRLRVAFVTTIVPGKEPLELVRTTLEAASAIRHEGLLDVWLLDEGDDASVRAMCAEVGAHHFSRRGVEAWNAPAGHHKAKTKHGNYNAWLQAHGDDYDVLVSVDPDHVPLPGFAERMLGFFRDPDVAFVVAPQVYGNYDTLITRAAESQQYIFHSVLQRAANRYGAPMLVGTNNAMRIEALRAIGGLHDSITEDAATSLVWHARRNPATGRRWRSVYTPDLLAIGEGPTSWTDYFTQQHRWARGGNEIVLVPLLRTLHRLRPVHALHYLLLMAFYPVTALAWLLGALNAVTYLLTGVGGFVVPPEVWVMFYVDAAALQLALFFWNRRHNVSPHEEEGSSGVAGMAISVLCGPVYVAAFLQGLMRRTSRFVVTPKGSSQSPDRLLTFSRHLRWAGLYGAALGASFVLGHEHLGMRLWAGVNLLVCLAPVALWGAGELRRLGAARRAAGATVLVLPLTALAARRGPLAPRTATDQEIAS